MIRVGVQLIIRNREENACICGSPTVTYNTVPLGKDEATRGDASNFPAGLTLPTRGLLKSTVNGRNLQKNSFSPSNKGLAPGGNIHHMF